MADFVVVQVKQRIESLSHDQSRLGLRQMLALGYEEKQLAAFAQPRMLSKGELTRLLKNRCGLFPRFHAA